MRSTGISFTYIKNKSGLRTDPWGVPALSFTLSDISSLILTVIVLSEISLLGAHYSLIWSRPSYAEFRCHARGVKNLLQVMELIMNGNW